MLHLLLFSLALLLIGCAKQPEIAAPPAVEQAPAVAAPSSATIEISDFEFVPDTATIAVGGEITWVQRDSAPHTVKFDDVESSRLSAGQSWSRRFDKPGSYRYICGVHPWMEGRVIVK